MLLIIRFSFLCFLCFLLFNPGIAFGHEVRPAYLELRQTGPETYAVLWKVPGLGENLRLGLYVELRRVARISPNRARPWSTMPTPSVGP